MNITARLSSSIIGYKLVFSNREYTKLFGLNTLTTLSSAMLGPVFPLWIMHVMHQSASSVFFVLSMVGIGGMVTNIYLGNLTDRIGNRKRAIEIGLILNGFKGILYTLFPLPLVVIVVSLVTQFSKASLVFAMLDDSIRKFGDEEKRGAITSTVRTGISVGYIVGPWLGIMIVEIVSFRYFFIAHSALYVFLFIFTRYMVNDPVAARSKTRTKRFKPQRNIILIALVLAVANLLLSGSVASGPLLALYVNSIASSWYVAAVFGIGPIFELIVIPLVGLINDRFGEYRTLLIGAMSEIIYFVLLSVTHMPAILLIIQVFGTLYTAILFTSLMLYVQNLFKNRPGFSSSLFYSSISSSRVFSQLVIGTLLLKWGVSACFLLLGSFSLAGMVLCIVTNLIARLSSSSSGNIKELEV